MKKLKKTWKNGGKRGNFFFQFFYFILLERNTNDAISKFHSKNEDMIPKCIQIGQTHPPL